MLYTVEQVAKVLAMHPRTVRRYIEKGQLAAQRIGGSWRISEEALSALFDSPETKATIAKHIENHRADALELYLKGQHRLQQDGPVMMAVFVFDAQKDAWALARVAGLMARLNSRGQGARFDFTMTGSEQGLYRVMVIGPHSVLQTLMAQLEPPE